MQSGQPCLLRPTLCRCRIVVATVSLVASYTNDNPRTALNTWNVSRVRMGSLWNAEIVHASRRAATGG
jgi:hypothetical protein